MLLLKYWRRPAVSARLMGFLPPTGLQGSISGRSLRQEQCSPGAELRGQRGCWDCCTTGRTGSEGELRVLLLLADQMPRTFLLTSPLKLSTLHSQACAGDRQPRGGHRRKAPAGLVSQRPPHCAGRRSRPCIPAPDQRECQAGAAVASKGTPHRSLPTLSPLLWGPQ